MIKAREIEWIDGYDNNDNVLSRGFIDGKPVMEITHLIDKVVCAVPFWRRGECAVSIESAKEIAQTNLNSFIQSIAEVKND